MAGLAVVPLLPTNRLVISPKVAPFQSATDNLMISKYFKKVSILFLQLQNRIVNSKTPQQIESCPADAATKTCPGYTKKTGIQPMNPYLIIIWMKHQYLLLENIIGSSAYLPPSTTQRLRKPDLTETMSIHGRRTIPKCNAPLQYIKSVDRQC